MFISWGAGLGPIAKRFAPRFRKEAISGSNKQFLAHTEAPHLILMPLAGLIFDSINGAVLKLLCCPISMRICNSCGQLKPMEAFESTGYKYRRRTCMRCRHQRTEENMSEEARARHKETLRKARRRLRDERPAVVICRDSRGSDKKAGRFGNDLDTDFVRDLISKGCTYCGEIEIRMTLDRIDNSLAHTKLNVIPACMRCNYARGGMPYEAWLFLIPGMKAARESGAFGTWTGRYSEDKNVGSKSEGSTPSFSTSRAHRANLTSKCESTNAGSNPASSTKKSKWRSSRTGTGNGNENR